MRALEKEKRIKEILEKDPGEIFNRALDILRKEDPEAFEDPYLIEQYVNSLSRWINELQIDLKLLDIFGNQNQGFNFKDCVKICIQLSGKSKSECSDHCRTVKAVLLESRFSEPPI